MNITDNYGLLGLQQTQVLCDYASALNSFGDYHSIDDILMQLDVDVIIEPGRESRTVPSNLEESKTYWENEIKKLTRKDDEDSKSALYNAKRQLNLVEREIDNLLTSYFRGLYLSESNVIKLFPEVMLNEYGGNCMNELLVSTLFHEAMHAYFNRPGHKQFPYIYYKEEPLAEFGMLCFLKNIDIDFYNWAYADVGSKRTCYKYGVYLMDSYLKGDSVLYDKLVAYKDLYTNMSHQVHTSSLALNNVFQNSKSIFDETGFVVDDRNNIISLFGNWNNYSDAATKFLWLVRMCFRESCWKIVFEKSFICDDQQKKKICECFGSSKVCDNGDAREVVLSNYVIKNKLYKVFKLAILFSSKTIMINKGTSGWSFVIDECRRLFDYNAKAQWNVQRIKLHNIRKRTNADNELFERPGKLNRNQFFYPNSLVYKIEVVDGKECFFPLALRIKDESVNVDGWLNLQTKGWFSNFLCWDFVSRTIEATRDDLLDKNIFNKKQLVQCFNYLDTDDVNWDMYADYYWSNSGLEYLLGEDYKQPFAVNINGIPSHFFDDGHIHMWSKFKEVRSFKHNFARVCRKKDGKWNFIKKDEYVCSDTPTFLSKRRWFLYAYDFNYGYAAVQRSDGLWNWIKGDGTLLSPKKWYKKAGDFYMDNEKVCADAITKDGKYVKIYG